MLAALSRHDGDEAAFAGADGSKLADALDELATSKAAAALLVDTSDYVELFSAALADRVVRPPPRPGARVRILGTIEARLTECDRVVLGGLVEGTWPPESRADAWLSRPMRLDLGLDLPERRVGLTAHDFAQLLGAEEVILSHAAKIAGTPTVPSRFVQRLAAVAGAERWKAAIHRGEAYLSWARALDRPEHVAAAAQPAPKPPAAARPKRLSVTDIEDWLRDPYTIYAKYILRLAPLDAVDLSPGAAERGTIIHNAIRDFTERYRDRLPADPARELIELGRPHFAELDDFPEARAFWWPRFQRIAHWFAGWEAARRPDIRALVAEIRGKIEIPLPEDAFTLNGIADRIERHADGRYVILDYKTGSARTEKQVRTGLAPQLTLEAAILRKGGFPDIAADSSVAQIGYVLLKGGAAARRTEAHQLHRRHGRQPGRSRIEKADRARRALRQGKRTLSLAGSSDVDDPLRRLRSSRARQGMVGDRRRDRRHLGQRMRTAASIPSEVRRKQSEASDPETSAWVAANAGSGKTYVLAQRVINLLLKGVEPEKILCITFTKAAAANMAKRVFDTLAEWTTLDDADLDDAIRQSSKMAPDARRRALARRLFARALETPGGLKVQTIHAFCTQLLHQFPFEADVTARFSVLDDAEQSQLLEQLTLGVLLEGAGNPGSALAQALNLAMTAAADRTFRDVVREAIGQGDAISRWVESAGGVEAAIANLARALGVEPSDSADEIEAEYFSGAIIAPSEWPAIANTIARGGKNDSDQAQRFASLPTLAGSEQVETYLDIFCTAAGSGRTARKTIITKAVGDAGIGAAPARRAAARLGFAPAAARRGVARPQRRPCHRRVRGGDALRQGEGAPRAARL